MVVQRDFEDNSQEIKDEIMFHHHLLARFRKLRCEIIDEIEVLEHKLENVVCGFESKETRQWNHEINWMISKKLDISRTIVDVKVQISVIQEELAAVEEL